VEAVLAALASDLDAPAAVAVVDAWAGATLDRDGTAGRGPGDPGPGDPGPGDPEAGATIRALVDAALGIAL
jgi:hypothetical protein